MKNRSATTVDKVAYLLLLCVLAGFWLFAAVIGGFMFWTAVRGRLDAGPLLNGAVAIYAVVWMGGLTALVVAFWKARRLTAEHVMFTRLARMPKPTDPVAASVWPWMKAAWWAWLFVVSFMGCLLITGLLGLW